MAGRPARASFEHGGLTWSVESSEARKRLAQAVQGGMPFDAAVTLQYGGLRRESDVPLPLESYAD